MTKLTHGAGWSLIADESENSSKTTSIASPRPAIRLEKRNGKLVTVISGLHTYGTDRLNTIAREIKKKCGSGGTVKSGRIEIQGDKTIIALDWLKNNI